MTPFYHVAQLDVVQLSLFPAADTPTKRCTWCEETKPLTDFPKCAHTKDGYTNPCKVCKNAKGRTKYAIVKEQQLLEDTPPKICTKCGDEKPAKDFDTEKSYCKKCRSQWAVQNMKKRRNTPEYQAWKQEYYSRPDYKRRNRANVRRWERTPRGRELRNAASRRINKTAKRKEFDRLRRLTPEYQAYHQAYAPKYAQQYPERVNEIRMRRVARKKKATIGKVSYKVILARDGYHCYICNQAIDPTIKEGPAKLHFDHVIALAKQGHHVESNIKPAHACCNLRKNARLLEEMDTWDRRGPDA